MKRLELEATNLRLIKSMADRLAHEVGNAMVPLSTHQQLLSEKYRDPEFRASLDAALADGVKRVTRLVNQMRFLARDSVVAQEQFPVSPLIEEAFQEARKYQPAKAAHLKYENGGAPAFVTGDRAALKYALTEVLINALQANPTEPKVGCGLMPKATVSPALDCTSRFRTTAVVSHPRPCRKPSLRSLPRATSASQWQLCQNVA